MNEFTELFSKSKALIDNARSSMGVVVNAVTVYTSYLLGKYMIEEEQHGSERAKYGSRVLDSLSDYLTEEYGRGFSRSNLAGMRKFYLTYRDREALIFGLVVASYGSEQKYTYKCPNCGREFEVNINLEANADVKVYDGTEDLINKEITVELPISKYKAILKLPTLFDSKSIYNIKGVDKSVLDKMSEFNIVKKLIVPGTEVDKATGEVKESEYLIDKLVDVYTTIKKLPARDRKAIEKAVMDVYGNYKITISIPTVCPSCGNEFETGLDVTQELFRNI